VEAGDLPFYAALHTREAPRVDGVLDEPCWLRAEQTASFVQIGGAAAQVESRSLACWDERSLYVAFICAEPLMADLQERIGRGEVQLFDESVEVFLDPACDRYSYLQLRVDVLGNRDTHRRNDPAVELDSQWSGAAGRGVDAWTVEMAVPFAMLGAPPTAGTVWSFNVNRQRIAHLGPVQWTCWSDTKGGFHSPSRFGHLVFTGYQAWLRFHFRSRLDAVEQEMGDLALRFPEVAGALAARLGQLDQQQVAFLGQVGAGEFGGEEDCRALFDRGEAILADYERALDEMRLVVIRDVLRKTPQG
jgi:hypothetical protein